MMTTGEFIETVWDYYHREGRKLPWRAPEANGGYDPYKIMVSEIMLQQTQVPRVVPKYAAFLEKFPDTRKLASSTLGEVLEQWSGLGYNRRAKFLHQAASYIAYELNNQFPRTLNTLTKLPGIGHNTAAAILAYAFNEPHVFVETNIRTVYIHHFLAEQDQISDQELLPLIESTLDKENPREWYWALMDYGTHIKAVHGNTSKLSKYYIKQSTFKGSKRQIRGQVLKLLITAERTGTELAELIPDSRLLSVLDDLLAEELIRLDNGVYQLH